jgi:purine-binding chemotaxis protein CheW
MPYGSLVEESAIASQFCIEGENGLLLCRVLTRMCALPLDHVQETMRPLPVAPMSGVPSFVRGVAVIRGLATPVVDGGSLLVGRACDATRFVTLKTGRRTVALAVDDVIGVRDLPPTTVEDLPPLLHEAGSGLISAIGTLDRDLLLVLRTARLVPESVWDALDARRSTP